MPVEQLIDAARKLPTRARILADSTARVYLNSVIDAIAPRHDSLDRIDLARCERDRQRDASWQRYRDRVMQAAVVGLQAGDYSIYRAARTGGESALDAPPEEEAPRSLNVIKGTATFAGMATPIVIAFLSIGAFATYIQGTPKPSENFPQVKYLMEDQVNPK